MKFLNIILACPESKSSPLIDHLNREETDKCVTGQTLPVQAGFDLVLLNY